MNPMAGVFTKRLRLRQAISDMNRVLAVNRIPVNGNHHSNPTSETESSGHEGGSEGGGRLPEEPILGSGIRADGSSWRVYEPPSKEALFTLIHSLCEKNRSCSDIGPKQFIVLAGGDGFHKDVCSEILSIDGDAIRDFIFFRLPMGTGNDSADAPTLAEACELFLFGGACLRRPVIKVTARGAAPDYCFNVFSLGIDAFVCLMTEWFKKIFPAGIFKVMTDFSAVFYDLFYPTLPMRLTITERSGIRHDLLRRFTLTVVGATGHTTYGGGMPVLPEEGTLCLVDAVPLMRKLALKKMFYSGEHRYAPETNMYSIRHVRFDYPNKILAELDGEPVLYDAGAFPVSVELIDPGFTVFRKPENYQTVCRGA
jgi:diacylglycerol kinase family enzyme